MTEGRVQLLARESWVDMEGHQGPETFNCMLQNSIYAAAVPKVRKTELFQGSEDLLDSPTQTPVRPSFLSASKPQAD